MTTEQKFMEELAPLVPTGAKAVIVAELVKDQSDVLSDYFGSTPNASTQTSPDPSTTS